MKTLVVYSSLCGSTKKYAETIAQKVDGDLLPIKKLKSKVVKQYDTIVFGGWVMNNEIKGLNEFLFFWEFMKEKNVIVFATGLGLPSTERRNLLIQTNLLDQYHLRFYQLRGSFDMSKVKFPYSTMLKMAIKTIKEDKSVQLDEGTLIMLQNRPFDYYDGDGVDKIVHVIDSLNIVEAEIIG